MGTVWFTSDLHFGHKNIHKFREGISSSEENENKILFDWLKVVNKRDDVYVLGDAAFTQDSLELLSTVPGRKYLVRGNHDLFDAELYLSYFTNIYGLLKYKEFWLSHAPVHPNELRYSKNIHGHVHSATIPDNNYLNVCIDNLWALGYPSLISIDQIRNGFIK